MCGVSGSDSDINCVGSRKGNGNGTGIGSANSSDRPFERNAE